MRPFVADRVGAREVDPQRVTAREVTSFMVAASARLGSKTVQRSASALRFWHLEGVVATSLVEVVPKVAHRAPAASRAGTGSGVGDAGLL